VVACTACYLCSESNIPFACPLLCGWSLLSHLGNCWLLFAQARRIAAMNAQNVLVPVSCRRYPWRARRSRWSPPSRRTWCRSERGCGGSGKRRKRPHRRQRPPPQQQPAQPAGAMQVGPPLSAGMQQEGVLDVIDLSALCWWSLGTSSNHPDMRSVTRKSSDIIHQMHCLQCR
jgi:hypothetical protein